MVPLYQRTRKVNPPFGIYCLQCLYDFWFDLSVSPGGEVWKMSESSSACVLYNEIIVIGFGSRFQEFY